MKVKDYMTPNPHTVGHDQPLSKANQLLREYKVRHLPVLKQGKLFGLLSDRDIKLAFSFIPSEIKTKEWKVEDACVDEVFTTHDDAPLKEVVSQMHQRGVGSAVVTNRDKVVGILTYMDVYKAMADCLK